MIEIHKYKLNPLYITIKTHNQQYLSDLKNYFTDYVEGFQFTPKYKSGQWNGKICLFKNNILPYGLLADVIRFTKKEYPLVNLKIDKDVSQMFKGYDADIEPSLSKVPRDYQLDCILACLKFKRGIIRSSTASGKSLVIAYIINDLFEQNLIKQSLIIVPTISLCQQFQSDMIEYGINKDRIGLVWEKEHSFDKDIVIATWQSLSKFHSKLSQYQCVIGDECHGIKSTELSKIFENCTNADYRFGFTGTLPTSKLDTFNVKAFLGPVLRDYGAGELAEKGYVSKCSVNIITITYNTDYDGEYNEVKDNVFNNNFRMGTIGQITSNLDSNVLILVSKVEKEGKILKDYFDSLKINREIIFLYGDSDVKEREFWRKECENRKDIIIIATYGIFSVGVNIPSLKYLLFASPVKGKIRVLQSIGRTLRIHQDKTEGSVVFDIVDDVKYLKEHGIKRERYYSSEGFKIIEIDMKETIFLDEILFQK